MSYTYSPTDFTTFEPVKTKAFKTTYVPALDLNFIDGTSAQAINQLLAPGRRSAFFMNAHCCNIRRKNPAYARAVSNADMLLPDGVGVELAAKMTGITLEENLNGTDLVPQVLKEAARMGRSVFLFGGKPGAADAAATNLVHKIPNLRIAGTRNGYEGAQDVEATIADINESGADIVLVALGVPVQEIWINKNAHRLNASLTMAVGALFDFLAEIVVRAPKLVRRFKMEWVWRLAQEPRRLATRYLAGNFTFLAHAAKTASKQIPFADMLRRGLDVTIAITALIVLAPLFVLTALAIKAESKGPVFFKQTRIGQAAAPFTMFKFRSMGVDAEERRNGLIATSDRDGICFKSRTDPRITRIGHFIRRFSIDELPQIINVLRGEMSIVGPRPALPSEVAQYPARAMGRLAVKPGITGLWQVSGRASIGFDKMVEMDLSYAACRTVLFDLTLIFRTFRAVVSGNGAY